MSEDDKKSRSGHKAALTRVINEVKRFVAEDDIAKVKERLPVLKIRFGEFETTHLKYHDALVDDNVIETSEEYFFKAQDTYVEVLTSANRWLKEQMEDRKTTASTSVSIPMEDNLSRAEVMDMLHLPKVEIEVFKGDPLRFHGFMSVFDEHVHRHRVSDKLKLARLLQYTDGKARDAIRPYAVSGDESGYGEARTLLKRRFGNDVLICEQVVSNIKFGKPVKSPLELQEFADELSTAYATLSSLKTLSEIDTQSCIVEINSRLQPYLRNRWKKEAMEMKRTKDCYPNFKDFVKFVLKEAEEATDPFYGNNDYGKRNVNAKPSEKKSSLSFSTNSSAGGSSKIQYLCVLCNESHKLFYCDRFKALKPSERFDIVKQHSLCENCLLANHVTSACRKKTTCSVPGCGKRHTKFIHLNPIHRSNQPESERDTMRDRTANVNACSNDNVNVCVPLVPVIVNEQFLTNALLDSGSTSSFCTERLVEYLKVKGTAANLTLITLSSSADSRVSKLVDLNVKSKDGHNEIKLSKVFVVKEIPVIVPLVDVQSHAHLSDMPFNNHDGVDILIGQDHSEALFPIDTKRGNRGEPFAVQTLLGWSINGPVSVKGPISKRVMSNFISNQTLDEKVQKLWDIENEEVGKEISWSKEDKQVIKLWDENVKIVDGKYELPVPWKPNCSRVNNIAVAQSRLKSLKTSLMKRGLSFRYNEEIVKLIQNGYAEIVPNDEINKCENVWYLPHQAVLNEKKPDKVRVVFDCASKFKGESLNDKCYQGPNLNNDLLSVLLRFRQHSYALTADVEAMYNQVRIPPGDRDMLRFLWHDDSGNVVHFRMTSHLFGGVWCSSSSAYALRHVLHDDPGVNGLVADTILRCFYVDDCLRSVETKQDACMVVSGTRNLLSKAGFRLTKFVANDKEILSQVPEVDRAAGFKEFMPGASSRVLGVEWNVSDDAFYFNVNTISCDSMSKRTMLSIVSAIFDPLGLITPVTILGRMIFQDVTRLKLPWDELVPVTVLRKWNLWIQGLRDIHLLQVPRCIKPTIFDDASIQLHYFCDASLKAFGGCCYVRCVNKEGRIHTALITSKAKVAPIKSQTIPRLELQSAVLIAKISSMLNMEMDLSVVKSFFWTDSQLVLKYIQNDSRRFHTFVANRVSTICDLTSSCRWFHVPGKDNPADLLTRGENPKSMDINKWMYGPRFLQTYESEWSISDTDAELEQSDPEVKGVYSYVTKVKDHPFDVLISHHSSWYKLKRAVAWLIRLKSRLKHKDEYVAEPLLTVFEISAAGVEIIRHVQSQYYHRELAQLINDKRVDKSSAIKDLSPQLNSEGIICVGGRIKHAKVSDWKKNPYILPHNHVVARLIVNDLHGATHLGVEWTLSLLRSKFWITKARVLIKSIRISCVTCKKLYVSSCVQKMSDLPSERLESGHPPFHYVGTDCFGPFQVKVGRSCVKRYGCLFTCLNTRAIHVEKLYSLETDSFLNGFRKFVSRRGMPSKIWSDNGLNYVGANNELAKCMREMNKHQIQNYAVKHNVEWSFIPPNAPHMGGIWERLVRIIKRVMSALLVNDHVRLTDEILDTIFCEVEAIVNSRPITKVSDSGDDLMALTPNHLLLLKEGPKSPPGIFKHGDMYRSRWRYVQHVCNEFWKRWLREYLPELQKRSKWLKVHENVKIGDLVLLMGENTPRCLWPMAIVTAVKYSDDGLVRSVNVKTRNSEFCRPIQKIVLLESSQ